jgi:hypothetical protein
MIICYNDSFPVQIFHFFKLQVLEASQPRSLLSFLESFFYALVPAFRAIHPSPPPLLVCDSSKFTVPQLRHPWPLCLHGLGSCVDVSCQVRVLLVAVEIIIIVSILVSFCSFAVEICCRSCFLLCLFTSSIVAHIWKMARIWHQLPYSYAQWIAFRYRKCH